METWSFIDLILMVYSKTLTICVCYLLIQTAGAKNLQHECNAGQKIKVETGPNEAYKLDLGHELHCTQAPAYNHKVEFNMMPSVNCRVSVIRVRWRLVWGQSLSSHFGFLYSFMCGEVIRNLSLISAPVYTSISSE